MRRKGIGVDEENETSKSKFTPFRKRGAGSPKAGGTPGGTPELGNVPVRSVPSMRKRPVSLSLRAQGPAVSNEVSKSVSSPRLGGLRAANSSMLRENSVELDSSTGLEALMSPRGFITKRAPLTPIVTRKGPGNSTMVKHMSSVDLEDVEVFRIQSNLASSAENTYTSGGDAGSEIGGQGLEEDETAHEVQKSALDEFTMLASTSVAYFNNNESVPKEELFTMLSNVLNQTSPELNVADCGHTRKLELRIKGLEDQLDAMRTAVQTLDGIKDEDAKTKNVPKKSWRDKWFHDPGEDRDKLLQEMETLFQTLNFMTRKNDEVRRMCNALLK